MTSHAQLQRALETTGLVKSPVDGDAGTEEGEAAAAPPAAEIETIAVRCAKPCEAAVLVQPKGEVWTYGYEFKAPATASGVPAICGPQPTRAAAILAALEKLSDVLVKYAGRTRGEAEKERLEKMARAVCRFHADSAKEFGTPTIPGARKDKQEKPADETKATPAKTPRRKAETRAADPDTEPSGDETSAAWTENGAGLVPVPRAELVDPDSIMVDAEFEGLCPPSSPEEQSLLEADLLANGCRDPLVLWSEPGKPLATTWTIIDGHNRLRICKQLRIELSAVWLDLPDRSAVINWIIANQLGRRNLSDEQKAYLRGKRYQAEKKAEGAPKANANAKAAKKQLGHNDPVESTAEKLGKEYNVAPKTVKRDAGVDAIEKEEGPQAKQEILAGKSKRTKKEVIAKVKPPKPAPAKQPKVKDKRLNEHGVFVRGTETVKVPTAKGISAEIEIVEVTDGDWRYTTSYRHGDRAASGPLSMKCKPCGSRLRALEAGAKSLIHAIGQNARSAGSAAEGRRIAALMKSIEKFIRELHKLEAEREKAAEADGPPRGRGEVTLAINFTSQLPRAAAERAKEIIQVLTARLIAGTVKRAEKKGAEPNMAIVDEVARGLLQTAI
jgi:hypothetical protein